MSADIRGHPSYKRISSADIRRYPRTLPTLLESDNSPEVYKGDDASHLFDLCAKLDKFRSGQPVAKIF